MKPKPALVTTPIVFGHHSDAGRRAANEDSFGVFPAGNRYLFVVADGMGGEAGGRVASSIAVDSSRRVFEANAGGLPAEILRECIASASEACIQRQVAEPELASMGSTLELLLVDGQQAWLGHVGDSRIYRVKAGKAERLTRDHTRVQQMLDDGFLTPAEAAEHPQRNVLSRVVGRKDECVPDVTETPLAFAEGDAFVLCSDGLTDVVTDEEIARVVSESHPEKACKWLVELALKKNTADNVTVQVVYRGKPKVSWRRRQTLASFGKVGEGSSPSGTRRSFITLAAGLVVGGLVGYGLGFSHARSFRPPRGAPSATPPATPQGTGTPDEMPSATDGVNSEEWMGTAGKGSAQVTPVPESVKAPSEPSDDLKSSNLPSGAARGPTPTPTTTPSRRPRVGGQNPGSVREPDRPGGHD